MTDASSAGPIHRPLIKIEGTVLAPDVIDKLIDCRLDLAISGFARHALASSA